MNRQAGCHHEWVKHGDRSFYCGTCGYFVETLEELQAVLNYERNFILSEIDKIVDEVNCQHCKEQLKQRLQELRK